MSTWCALGQLWLSEVADHPTSPASSLLSFPLGVHAMVAQEQEASDNSFSLWGSLVTEANLAIL